MILTKTDSNVIKGLSIIVLLIHHYSGMKFSYENLSMFRYTGVFVCSAFYFISGYAISLKQKRNISFWSKRFIKILIPFWIANLIYITWNIINGQGYEFVDCISELIGLTLVNGHCWFLQVLILMYMSLWISDTLLEKKCVKSIFKTNLNSDNQLFIVGGIASCILTGLIYVVLTYKTYGLSYIAFPIGMIAAKNEKKVKLSYTIVGAILLVITTWIFVFKGHGIINSYFIAGAVMVMIISFTIIIPLVAHISLVTKLRLPLTKLGSNTMSYYMIHGLCLRILNNIQFDCKLIYVALYMVMVIVFAWMFDKIVLFATDSRFIHIKTT